MYPLSLVWCQLIVKITKSSFQVSTFFGLTWSYSSYSTVRCHCGLELVSFAVTVLKFAIIYVRKFWKRHLTFFGDFKSWKLENYFRTFYFELPFLMSLSLSHTHTHTQCVGCFQQFIKDHNTQSYHTYWRYERQVSLMVESFLYKNLARGTLVQISAVKIKPVFSINFELFILILSNLE